MISPTVAADGHASAVFAPRLLPSRGCRWTRLRSLCTSTFACRGCRWTRLRSLCTPSFASRGCRWTRLRSLCTVTSPSRDILYNFLLQATPTLGSATGECGIKPRVLLPLLYEHVYMERFPTVISVFDHGSSTQYAHLEQDAEGKYKGKSHRQY